MPGPGQLMGESAIAEHSMETAISQIIRLDFGGAVWEMRCRLSEFRVELDDRRREFVNRHEGIADAVVDVEWADAFPDPGPVLFDAGIWRAHAAGDDIAFEFF